MLPTPLEYLIAFAICSLLGALWTICVGCYVRHVR
ncbi:putative membrane protein [Burkholderia pseudomallei]|nr:putative membrane protein [Burkholderia pseudomallei]